jgi:serine/threonine protein phosphatase PrpC
MGDFDDKPLEFLQNLIKNLVKTLKSRNVDTKSSGCSCVISLIHKDALFTANIGNSRSILGTYRSNIEIDQRHITAMQEQNFLKDLSKRRRSSLTRQPFAYQLTKDHMTSNQEEFMRILKAGGRLLKPESKPGEKEMPYKVYLPHSQLPGIVVTRSIGHSIAESIGVVPNPNTSKYALTVEDEFIVLVSEGVSLVMGNDDIVNFVAKYRKIANRKVENHLEGERVTPSNSCIAQLLCEEARYRWISIVENEDSFIEDISCVILEIDNRVEKRSNTFYRMQIDRIGTSREVENNRLNAD